ncbi:MAG: hypothetical protein KGQ60_17645, partial [Planctomycetes bacterium]|nr:hypothetical protein [Planctomycetota bacterium]
MLRQVTERLRAGFAALQKRRGPRLLPKRLSAIPRSFVRLEPRRLLAVDAFFGAGALSIEITSVGEQHANLIANGSDFFVDANNDSLFNPLSELSASLDSLERIQVTSADQVGVFRWIGDFTAAPLSGLTALDIQDIQSVEIQASANVLGQASVFASDSVGFHSAISFQGDLIVELGPGGSISDSATSQVTVLGNLSLRTNSSLSLGDEST